MSEPPSRCRVMLRWIRYAAVFLLLGAIVNVAVAWGCVINTGRAPVDELSFVYSGSVRAFVMVSKRFGTQTIRYFGERSNPALVRASGVEELTLYSGDLTKEDWARNDRNVLTRAGWPMVAMEGWELDQEQMQVTGTPQSLFNRVDNSQWGLIVNLPWPHDVLVPLRPIALGFAVNMLFYGTLIATIVYGPKHVRAQYRGCRSRCIDCGYPIGTSPVCTECGVPLARTTAMSND